MILRRANERGHFENEWLNTYHTFSFAEYLDPKHMGFHDLRVINDDLVKPEAGFPTHGHRDMEIISYICEGRIAHRDSMGNVRELNAGEIQVMSAGSGVRHSEFNPDPQTTLRLLQIWILPRERGIEPSYSEKSLPRADKLNQLRLIVSPDGRQESLAINQNAELYATILEAGKALEFTIEKGWAVWLQVVDGDLNVNGTQRLVRGDAVALQAPEPVKIAASSESEFLLFHLPQRNTLE